MYVFAKHANHAVGTEREVVQREKRRSLVKYSSRGGSARGGRGRGRGGIINCCGLAGRELAATDDAPITTPGRRIMGVSTSPGRLLFSTVYIWYGTEQQCHIPKRGTK